MQVNSWIEDCSPSPSSWYMAMAKVAPQGQVGRRPGCRHRLLLPRRLSAWRRPGLNCAPSYSATASACSTAQAASTLAERISFTELPQMANLWLWVVSRRDVSHRLTRAADEASNPSAVTDDW